MFYGNLIARNIKRQEAIPVAFLVPAKKTTCLTGGSEFGFSLDKKTSNATMSVGLTPHYIEKQRRYPWIIVHYHIRHGIVSII
jgi:hypothetical protein